MKRLYRFLLYFMALFAGGLIVNSILKHNLEIITAFSVAIGVSLGMIFLGEKFKDK